MKNVMKNWRKRLLVIALVAILALAMAACHEQKTPDVPRNTDPTVPNPSATDGLQTPEETFAPGPSEVKPTPSETAPVQPPDDPEPTTVPTQSTTSTQPPAPTSYQISYAGLEGAAHSNPSSYTDAQAASITLSEPSQRKGYTFDGWYVENRKITTLEGFAQDLEITAKWFKNKENTPAVLPSVDFS